jgi:hypothetical protein
MGPTTFEVSQPDDEELRSVRAGGRSQPACHVSNPKSFVESVTMATDRSNGGVDVRGRPRGADLPDGRIGMWVSDAKARAAGGEPMEAKARSKASMGSGHDAGRPGLGGSELARDRAGRMRRRTTGILNTDRNSPPR